MNFVNITDLDILMTAVCLAVQNVEALSESMPGQKEAIAKLDPQLSQMVTSFYKKGYYMQSGPDFDAYNAELVHRFNVDISGSKDEGMTPSKLRKVIGLATIGGGDTEFLAAARKFFINFEG